MPSWSLAVPVEPQTGLLGKAHRSPLFSLRDPTGCRPWFSLLPLDAQQLHLKVQGRIGRNHATGASCTVSNGGRAGQLGLATDLHDTIGRRIIKFSGVKSWDNAVLRALDRTEKLPSDNGRYWNPMVIQFKLRD